MIRKPIRFLLLSLVALCSGVLLLVGTAIFLLDHVAAGMQGSATLPVDCIVVFGAAVHKENRAGPGIYRRVQTAAELYTAGKAQKLFMTGGKGNAMQDSEAQVMQRTAIALGVPAQNIFLEEEATSTWENLAFVRPLVDKEGCTTTLGISDGYHLARIEYLASQQGWGNLRTLPATKRPEKSFEVRAIVREALGIVFYFFNQFLPLDTVITPEVSEPSTEVPFQRTFPHVN